MSRADKHLGSQLSAVVDGEVGHAERERLFAHLARCSPCRELVDSERRLKARLGGLSHPPTPDSLVERLRELPTPGRGAGGLGRELRPSARPTTPRREGHGPGSRRPRSSPRVRGGGRLRRTAAGAGLAMAAALTTAFAIGGDQSGGTVRPAVEKFGVEHASVTGTVPLVDPASLVSGAMP